MVRLSAQARLFDTSLKTRAPVLSTTGIAGCAMVRALMNAEDPAALAKQALASFAGPR